MPAACLISRCLLDPPKYRSFFYAKGSKGGNGCVLSRSSAAATSYLNNRDKTGKTGTTGERGGREPRDTAQRGREDGAARRGGGRTKGKRLLMGC